MGQLVSLSSELPPELLSSDLPSSELPPAQPDNDEFPLDPWDEELSELVLDLEATASDQLLQDGSGLPPPSTNLDDATPQQVLGRLLGLMSSPSNRHYERYGAFATKDTDGLIALLMSCLRPEVAPLVELRKTSSVAKVASLGGDLQYRGRAIYLHIVTLPDGTNWYYIGQAYNLSYRIFGQHRNFRYRRDHVSFHNYVVDRSTKDVFVVLATLTKPVERSDLIMNVLETWCCLLFRSLPKATLEEWLDSGLEEGIPSLNIALPLDTGDEMASKTAFELLREADETLAKEYYWNMKKGRLRPKPVVTTKPAAVIRTIRAVEGRQPGTFASMVVSGMIGFCIAAVFFSKARIRTAFLRSG